ncbi:hypothetical protein [Paraburkholderia sp. SOS3]|uniref:hypothetical protein n=1 Tax=Paraburkholderia sp. SOS3 TaxID=1926494 RepID=UPI0009478430|nr:hypothetical protein [Paraburkholderia sp. SOS3]APR40011.1 hypothetical protein BTO02_33250 [Paraburkholderia sp. SOS3]
MKRAWDPVKLRVASWEAPAPECGDELLTRTGRRYRILEVRTRRGAIVGLDCMVLPKSEPASGRIFNWVWNVRGRQ